MCKLMGDEYNFVNFVLIITVLWVSTTSRQAINTTGIKMTKNLLRALGLLHTPRKFRDDIYKGY